MVKKKSQPKWYERKLDLTVVGLRHWLTPPQIRELDEITPVKISVRREPDNPHDENALAVDLAEGFASFSGKVGYLRRQLAETLAPLVDEGELEISEGWITSADDEQGEATSYLNVRTRQKSLQISY